jgi:hypothetical protein
MAWAEPDDVIAHRPAGTWGCGADLASAADLGVAAVTEAHEGVAKINF